MQPGGMNEIIERFIGHLHIAEESARARIEFEEFGKGKPRDVDTNLPGRGTDAPAPDIDEIGAVRLNARYDPAMEEFHEGLLPAQKLAGADGAALMAKLALKPLPALTDIPHGGGGGGSPNTFYDDIRAENRMVDIDQINDLQDDDMSLTSEFDVSSLVASHAGEMESAFQLSQDDFPSDLPAGGVSTTEFIEWATSRTADELANREPSDDAQTLEAGRYVDGQKVEEPLAAESSAQTAQAPQAANEPGSGEATTTQEPSTISVRPELLPPEYEYGVTEFAQVIQAGGNQAENFAQIIDVNAVTGSMMVMGDWFKTNAIYQTNVYSDHDNVSQYGPGNATIETGGNIADNVAELIHASAEDQEFLPFLGGYLHVDRIAGDVFDVKLLTQTNLMQDNDVATQSTYVAFSQIEGGDNVQVNASWLYETFQSYDMIIIGGNVYSANLIYQTNIVLDDDVVVMSQGEGADADQSIYTGQNWLYNSATIQDIGGAEPTPWDSNYQMFANGIAQNEANVDPTVAWNMPGNGSLVLNVLYISGDYYDLNLISQINVILDSDVTLQNYPGGTDGFIQYTSTGNNGAANIANIATVGALDGLYVKGEVYEDFLLVQAEIVLGEDDEVLIDHASNLPPELVAFTTDDAAEPPPSDQTFTADTATMAPQNDVLAGMLH